MKTKNILLALLFLFTISTYAQNEKSILTEKEKAITEISKNKFVVQAQKLNDLAFYNWSVLNELFKSESKNTKLKIIIQFDRNGTFDNVDNDDYYKQYKCKVYELKDVIKKLELFSNDLRA